MYNSITRSSLFRSSDNVIIMTLNIDQTYSLIIGSTHRDILKNNDTNINMTPLL